MEFPNWPGKSCTSWLAGVSLLQSPGWGAKKGTGKLASSSRKRLVIHVSVDRSGFLYVLFCFSKLKEKVLGTLWGCFRSSALKHPYCKFGLRKQFRLRAVVRSCVYVYPGTFPLWQGLSLWGFHYTWQAAVRTSARGERAARLLC